MSEAAENTVVSIFNNETNGIKLHYPDWRTYNSSGMCRIDIPVTDVTKRLRLSSKEVVPIYSVDHADHDLILAKVALRYRAGTFDELPFWLRPEIKMIF